MSSRSITLLIALLASFAPVTMADIVWTGAVSNDIFEDLNWDLSASTVTAVDPNVSINDDVLIANTVQPVEIPNLAGQGRFQVADGFVLTIDNAQVRELGNDGIGGAPGTSIGPEVKLINGSKLQSFFITNRTSLDVGLLCLATLDGGATPINGSTVNLTSGATLAFSDETVADYLNEHLSKTRVDGSPAVLGVNVLVASDGGSGCVVTVIPPFTSVCLGLGAVCPCGNGNDGSNGSAGCANSMQAGGALLTAGGTNSIQVGDLVLIANRLVPSRMGVFFQGNVVLNSGAGLPFGDGLRCAGGGVRRLETVMADSSGVSSTTIHVALHGAVSPGMTQRYQLWYGDNSPSPCGTGFNLSNALEVTWAP